MGLSSGFISINLSENLGHLCNTLRDVLGQVIFGHNQDKSKVTNVGTLVRLTVLDDLPNSNQNTLLSYVPPDLEFNDVILTKWLLE